MNDRYESVAQTREVSGQEVASSWNHRLILDRDFKVVNHLIIFQDLVENTLVQNWGIVPAEMHTVTIGQLQN